MKRFGLFFGIGLIQFLSVTNATACLSESSGIFPTWDMMLFPTIIFTLTGLLMMLSFDYLTKICGKLSLLEKIKILQNTVAYEKYVYAILAELLVVGVILSAIIDLIINNPHLPSETYITLKKNLYVIYLGHLLVSSLYGLVFYGIKKEIKLLKNEQKSTTLKEIILSSVLSVVFWGLLILICYCGWLYDTTLKYGFVVGLLCIVLYVNCPQNKLYLKRVYSGLLPLMFLLIIGIAGQYSSGHSILYEVYFYDPCPQCDCL